MAYSTPNDRYNDGYSESGGPLSMANLPQVQTQNYGSSSNVYTPPPSNISVGQEPGIKPPTPTTPAPVSGGSGSGSGAGRAPGVRTPYAGRMTVDQANRTMSNMGRSLSSSSGVMPAPGPIMDAMLTKGYAKALGPDYTQDQLTQYFVSKGASPEGAAAMADLNFNRVPYFADGGAVEPPMNPLQTAAPPQNPLGGARDIVNGIRNFGQSIGQGNGMAAFHDALNSWRSGLNGWQQQMRDWRDMRPRGFDGMGMDGWRAQRPHWGGGPVRFNAPPPPPVATGGPIQAGPPQPLPGGSI